LNNKPVKIDTMIGAHAVKVLDDVVAALADTSQGEQTPDVLKASSMRFLL
jgi:hypothetical protein